MVAFRRGRRWRYSIAFRNGTSSIRKDNAMKQNEKNKRAKSRMGLGYGSEFHLLRWLGRHRANLNSRLEQILGSSNIQWMDFQFCHKNTDGDIPDTELRGLEFLEGNPNYQRALDAFRDGPMSWPQKGEIMNWDAIGRVGNMYILCEAKAHLEEVEKKYDPGDSPSIKQRERAFSFAKEKFGASPDADWMHNFYQMANRLYIVALLEECKIPAILLNIYFCGDKHRDWVCPQTPEEWAPLLRDELEALKLDKTNKFFVDHVENLFLPIEKEP